jgi:hypothetical protein
MSFKAVPLDMISAPNFFSPLADNRWVITSPNAQTLWLQLSISDSLGDRRYIPANGSVLEATFHRSDLLSIPMTTPFVTSGLLNSTARSIVKICAANANDKSLYSIAMSSADIQGIVSGATKFKLTESTVVTEWLFDWSIVKKLTSPGC